MFAAAFLDLGIPSISKSISQFVSATLHCIDSIEGELLIVTLFLLLVESGKSPSFLTLGTQVLLVCLVKYPSLLEQ